MVFCFRSYLETLYYCRIGAFPHCRINSQRNLRHQKHHIKGPTQNPAYDQPLQFICFVFSNYAQLYRTKGRIDQMQECVCVCIYIHSPSLPLNPNKPLIKVPKEAKGCTLSARDFMTALESPCKIPWLIPTSRENSQAQAVATASTSST